MDPSQLQAKADDDSLQFEEGYIFQPTDIPKFVLAKERKVHVSQLQWDKNTQLGQIRSLNSTLVAHYARRLKASPPRKLIRILARVTQGMNLRSPSRS